jgi:lipoprotein-anchoring transpeptidase ErfK/SrfK
MTMPSCTVTIPDDNKQPLEYFAAKYQMGLSNMLEANPGVDNRQYDHGIGAFRVVVQTHLGAVDDDAFVHGVRQNQLLRTAAV